MQLKTYLLIATIAFLVAVSGSDLFARMTVSQVSFSQAVNQHLEWASLTLVGIVVLLVPFIAIALICARVNRSAGTRSAAALFGVGLAALLYFYFGGFVAAEQAMINQRWTAAALSIGLLPFFVGLPTILLVAGAGFIVSRIDPHRPASTVEESENLEP